MTELLDEDQDRPAYGEYTDLIFSLRLKNALLQEEITEKNRELRKLAYIKGTGRIPLYVETIFRDFYYMYRKGVKYVWLEYENNKYLRIKDALDLVDSNGVVTKSNNTDGSIY